MRDHEGVVWAWTDEVRSVHGAKASDANGGVADSSGEHHCCLREVGGGSKQEAKEFEKRLGPNFCIERVRR